MSVDPFAVVAMVAAFLVAVGLGFAGIEWRRRRREEELDALAEAEALQARADTQVVMDVMQAVDRGAGGRRVDPFARAEEAELRASRAEAELQRVRQLARRERIEMANLIVEAGGTSDGRTAKRVKEARERASRAGEAALAAEAELKRVLVEEEERSSARRARQKKPSLLRPPWPSGAGSRDRIDDRDMLLGGDGDDGDEASDLTSDYTIDEVEEEFLARACGDHELVPTSSPSSRPRGTR